MGDFEPMLSRVSANARRPHSKHRKPPRDEPRTVAWPAGVELLAAIMVLNVLPALFLWVEFATHRSVAIGAVIVVGVVALASSITRDPFVGLVTVVAMTISVFFAPGFGSQWVAWRFGPRLHDVDPAHANDFPRAAVLQFRDARVLGVSATVTRSERGLRQSTQASYSAAPIVSTDWRGDTAVTAWAVCDVTHDDGIDCRALWAQPGGTGLVLLPDQRDGFVQAVEQTLYENRSLRRAPREVVVRWVPSDPAAAIAAEATALRNLLVGANVLMSVGFVALRIAIRRENRRRRG